MILLRNVLIFTLLCWLTSAQAQVPAVPPVPKPDAKPTPVPAPPTLGAKSYILVDFDSQRVLIEENADLRVEPASITKLMTSYVVFKSLADGKLSLDDTVAVSENAWRTGGSRMFIEPSMTPSVQELIHGMVIQSGNDACVALAEHIAGSEEAFAGLMNHYAGEMGMTATHFTNSTGWPDEAHYTTARDIARLSAAIIRDFPEYYAWYAQKEYTFNGIRQHNRNTLLWRDPSIDGLKTGHTEAAGYCLASSAIRDGMRLISAVMGSASESSRASESQTLLNYGFRFFETVQLYQARSELARGKVWKGLADDVALGLAQSLFVTIPRGRYAELEAKVEMQPALSAPLPMDAVVGMITVSLGDELVAQRELITLDAIAPAGFFGRTWDALVLWADSWFADGDDG